jgi:hypothetical protein
MLIIVCLVLQGLVLDVVSVPVRNGLLVSQQLDFGSDGCGVDDPGAGCLEELCLQQDKVFLVCFFLLI